MGKAFILWLLGVPFTVLLVLWVVGILRWLGPRNHNMLSRSIGEAAQPLHSNSVLLSSRAALLHAPPVQNH